jgi:LmbE family N-acetylglucosaminyl deacetylase
MYPWPIQTEIKPVAIPHRLVSNLTARPLELPSRLLAVFAHPDDEIGAVGTMAEVVRAGGTVRIVWLTRGELASQFSHNSNEEVWQIREAHGLEVARLLRAEHRFLDFPDAGLTGGREEALSIACEIAEFKPDAIITWDPFDMHPDHRATYWACLSALKLCRIPKLMNLRAYRQPVRLYHYYSNDLPRPQVYADIAVSMPVLERIYAFYQDTYHWPWTVNDLRSSRLLIGARVGATFAERFQIASLEHAEGLPLLSGIARSSQETNGTP